MSWFILALGSAFFAGLTAILAKIGVKDVDSNLATAIRTAVILPFAWGIVAWQGTGKQLFNLNPVAVRFLVASGITTGLSWLCYFRALSLADAARVAPIDKLSLVFTIVLAGIFLHEKINLYTAGGGVLMTLGALCVWWGGRQ